MNPTNNSTPASETPMDGERVAANAALLRLFKNEYRESSDRHSDSLFARDYIQQLERELTAEKAECERLREQHDIIQAQIVLPSTVPRSYMEIARDNGALRASHASLCAALEEADQLVRMCAGFGLTEPSGKDGSPAHKIATALAAANRIAALKVRESGAVGALEFALPWLQEGKEVCIEAQHFEEAVRVKEKQKAGERGLAALLAIITEGTP